MAAKIHEDELKATLPPTEKPIESMGMILEVLLHISLVLVSSSAAPLPSPALAPALSHPHPSTFPIPIPQSASQPPGLTWDTIQAGRPHNTIDMLLFLIFDHFPGIQRTHNNCLTGKPKWGGHKTTSERVQIS